MQPTKPYRSEDLHYLKMLARQYTNVQAASTEIVNLQAIRNLPKGTEHFISDVHGEYEAFLHILNSASGVVREKVDALFATGVQPDPADLPQPLLEEALNSGCCRAAGFPEKGRPRDFFRADLARLLGGPADGREGERPYVGVD